MDQVRTILRIIWQQRFWVLTGLGLLIAAICWKMAAGSLDKEFAANKSTIDGKFKAMSDLSGQQVWGNDEVNAREFQETSAIRDKVLEMWQTLYRAQRDNVLKWPKGLGEEFLQYVEGKRFRTPISDPDMRQIYRQYAKEAFPDLVAIVQAQKIPDGTMSAGGMAGEMGGGRFDGAFGPPGGMGVQQFDAMGNPIEEEKYIVRWHDQVALRDQLDFRSLPTSLRVWLTQEDLWVYETLLHAIAKTNNEHGSTRYDNAAISDIYFLEVGRPAAMAFREPGLVSLPAAGMGAGGMEMDRGMESPPRGYEGDPMSSMGGMGAETVDPDAGLMAFRYIGDDGQPITDDTGAVDPSAQFRRLPVRMVLRMEQGAIPELLVQCANATLPVEVKRVRINSDKSEMGAAATADAAGMGGGMGGYPGRGGGEFGGGRGGGEFGGGRGGGEFGGGRGPMMMPGMSMPGTADGMARPELVTVEIHGIVYIYNPPDASTLTVPGGPESVASLPDATALAARREDAAGALPAQEFAR